MKPRQCTPPPSLRAFRRDQEHYLKHPGWVDLISTKQNKQTTFLKNMGDAQMCLGSNNMCWASRDTFLMGNWAGMKKKCSSTLHLRPTPGSTSTCRCWFTLARLSGGGGRKLCNGYHPVKTRVTGGYIWTRFQQGHGGGQGNPAISITRWKPGWPVDIYERAFNKDTVGSKETRQYLSPGENRVTRGYTCTRFREVHSCYQGKKRKPLGTIAYFPVKTRVTRWWILTRFR